MSKHSQKRALERYNLSLTKKEEQEIIELIRENKIIALGTSEENKNLKFAYVVYNHIPLKVLYERSNKYGVKNIITIYPFDADEYNNLLKNDFQQKIDIAIKFLKRNGYIVYMRKAR